MSFLIKFQNKRLAWKTLDEVTRRVGQCCYSSKKVLDPSTNPRKLILPKNDLFSYIYQRIKLSGPISVAQYMRDVLTNPLGGYYVHRDMIGGEGDFVTSPEMNQMFGELIAIWFISEWKALGAPKRLRFVEMGPGRGTLAEDMLRTFTQLKAFQDVELSFDFVEINQKLAEIQLKKLAASQGQCDDRKDCYQSGLTMHGIPLNWYKSLEHVPNDQFVFFIAHEFLDALPIHKFVRTKEGWRELYVDIDPGSEKGLRLVILPEVTMASRRLIKEGETRDHVEISVEAGAVVEEMAKRIVRNNGASLIVDYGHLGDKTDTFRGFKNHKLNDVFHDVGEADLTADVDFSYICKSTGALEVQTNGPVTQQTFLKNMGVEVRLMMLLRSCKDFEQRKKLVESYKIIMDEKHMGERFKFLSLTSKNRCEVDGKVLPVTGF